MKTNIFFKYIISKINLQEGICSKQVLAKSFNIKPHNIQKIIREFNQAYPKYAIKSNNEGYFISHEIPQEILNNLPGVSILELYISFTIKELFNSITIPNYTCSVTRKIRNIPIYKKTVESCLKNFGIPPLNNLLNTSLSSKIYLLSILPYYVFINSSFEERIFFEDSSIYNINNLETFKKVKKIAKKYSNDIINTLGDEYKTSSSYYILFFYFLFEISIYINQDNNNSNLDLIIDKQHFIFDYDSFNIPNFCDSKILTSLLILELHLTPKKNLSLEKSFKLRLNTLSFYPLFGIFTPSNNELILSTYSIYIKLTNIIDQKPVNSYTINKLILVHLVNFRKNIIFKAQFDIPQLNKFNYNYQVIYKCPFSNDMIGICENINTSSYLNNSNNSKLLLIPNSNIEDLITNNCYTLFPKATVVSLDKFELNYIIATNKVNSYLNCERLLINFPNANINFYSNLSNNIPKDNYFSQLMDNNPLPLKDENNNFSYEAIITGLKHTIN